MPGGHVVKGAGPQPPAGEAVEVQHGLDKLAPGHARPGGKGVAAGALHDSRRGQGLDRLPGIPVPPQVHEALQRQGLPAAVGGDGIAVNPPVPQGIAVDGDIVVGLLFRHPGGADGLRRVVPADRQGVPLDGEEGFVLHVEHQADVVNPALDVTEEGQVPLEGDVAPAPGGAAIVAAQGGEGPAVPGTADGPGEGPFGDSGLLGAPGDEHVAPVPIGDAEVVPEGRVLVVLLGEAHLRQRLGHHPPRLGYPAGLRRPGRGPTQQGREKDQQGIFSKSAHVLTSIST